MDMWWTFVVLAVVFLSLTESRRVPGSCLIPTGEAYEKAKYRPFDGDILLAGAKVTAGKTIQIVCYNDIDLDSILEMHSSRCRHGQWFPPLPKCLPGFRPCERRPSSVSNARPTGPFKHSYRTGETVTFVCNPGYTMKGESNSRMCFSGRWASAQFVCVRDSSRKQCLNKGIENGEISLSPSTDGTHVNVSCDAGFRLTGPHEVTCVNASLYPFSPVCQPELCSPYHLGNYTVISPGLLSSVGFPLSHGAIVKLVLECKTGYLPRGNQTRMKCVKGKWTRFPSCRPACRLPQSEGVIYRYARRQFSGEPIKHGTYIASGRRVRKTCTSPRYRRRKRPSSKCANGLWKPALPKARCPDNQVRFKSASEIAPERDNSRPTRYRTNRTEESNNDSIAGENSDSRLNETLASRELPKEQYNSTQMENDTEELPTDSEDIMT